MKIGFNAQIVSRTNAGVATYTKNLIHHLVLAESEHEFYVFGNREFLPQWDSPRVKLVPTNSKVAGNWSRILWEQFVLPLKFRRYNLEAMYYPDHTSSLFPKTGPVIITIHDLAFLAHPEAFTARIRMYKTLAVKQSVRQADRIVVVSEATKRECLKWLGLPESKLRVIPNGIDPAFTPISDKTILTLTRQKFGLNSEFILYVGTLEPRKNLLRLIEAYSDLRKKRGIEHELIIAGGKGWLYSDIFAKVEKLSLGGKVRFLGYVTREDLIALYNLAEVFVYPSIYEGFGFPPLEAMACGCPVVTSNLSSLPEVVGDAALRVDAYDPVAIGEAIFNLISDPEYRQSLRQKGFERVKLFAWDKVAKKNLQVINEL